MCFQNLNKSENNIGDRQEETFSNNSDNEIETYVQVCKKTVDLTLYQYHFFSIKMIHVLFQIDKYNFNTLLYRNCLNTCTTVKTLTKHNRLCQKKELGTGKFPEKKYIFFKITFNYLQYTS